MIISLNDMHSVALKIPIHPIPGPSALVAALSVAGFAASPCTFLGFLPVKGAARSELLELMATTTHTMVFYESPHRIRKTIQDLLHHRRDAEGRAGEVVPGLRSRSIVVCRELTKLYEELIRGSLVEVAEALSIPTEESETEQLPETSLLVCNVSLILLIKYYCVGDTFCCCACQLSSYLLVTVTEGHPRRQGYPRARGVHSRHRTSRPLPGPRCSDGPHRHSGCKEDPDGPEGGRCAQVGGGQAVRRHAADAEE